ncbi:hypothetical protein DFP83_101478 [Idiomarina fontislapidosi]|uniref:Uncharacterized protein n=2 Tax=Idiomarina fontislapidosi TaxID=263723 RepID=A0A432YC79_9GAMM|nr:hypothetical protein DFP83_101478 [Idiomarina fontislapidosi]RUO58462.1 hypothetical protein CWE25_02405 [Idiomarina fontislapidosi]
MKIKKPNNDGAYKFGSKKDPKKFDGHVVTYTASYGTDTSKLTVEQQKEYFDSLKAAAPDLLKQYEQTIETKRTQGIDLEPSLTEYEERYFKPVLEDLSVPIPSNLGFYLSELALIEWKQNFPHDEWERAKSMAETACKGLSAINGARAAISANNYQQALVFMAQAGHHAVTLRTQIMERGYRRGEEKTEGLTKGNFKYSPEQKEQAQELMQKLVDGGKNYSDAARIASNRLDIPADTLTDWRKNRTIIVVKPF